MTLLLINQMKTHKTKKEKKKNPIKHSKQNFAIQIIQNFSKITQIVNNCHHRILFCQNEKKKVWIYYLINRKKRKQDT